jgi:LTXXQ motif family protein
MRPQKLFLLSVAITAFASLSTIADARPRLPGLLGAVAGTIGGIVGLRHHAMARPRHHVRRASMRLPLRHAAAAAAAPAALPAPAAGNPGIGATGAFWPRMYEDVFDYVFWPSSTSDRVWSYGYSDIVAGMFASGSKYVNAPALHRRSRQTNGTASDGTRDADSGQRCAGIQSGDAVTRLVERIERTVSPTETQQNALMALRAALQRAFEYVDAACPVERQSAPTARLDVMDDRLWAGRQALLVTRASIESFYNALTDEQKAALNAPSSNEDQRHEPCGQQGADLPSAQIEQRVRPSQEQRPAWEALRMTSMGMARFLQASCPASTPTTPLERLDAFDKRLNSLLYAVVNLRPPLDAFYSSLGSEQKARFNTVSR